MIIRKSTPGDATVLLDIWLRSVRASHVFLTEEDIRTLLPIVRDQALPCLDLWILCDDACVPIGFMGVGENTIEALFITPQYFRRGGGKMLVEFARSRLTRPLRVDVNEQNGSAMQFYAAMGFEVIGRSPLDSDGRPFPLLHMLERE